jgi:hypothetical protein
MPRTLGVGDPGGEGVARGGTGRSGIPLIAVAADVKGDGAREASAYARRMNTDDEQRYAAGETDKLPPAPRGSGLTEEESVRKDMTYSPASETETQRKQDDDRPASLEDDDIDDADVRVVPGTGGPDDAGDVEVDPDELNLPGR